LFDLDHWHISQPPANLAEIDPEGAAIAEQVARVMRGEKEDAGTESQKNKPDKRFEEQDGDDEDEDIVVDSFFTVDAFHWGVSSARPR
jgi:hypothetical protein